MRRDWSNVARRFQRELLTLVFHDRPVDDFVRGFVAELRAGSFDAQLAYKKAIRKPLADYTKTTPPHVKAARKQGGRRGTHRRLRRDASRPRAGGRARRRRPTTSTT